MMESQQTELNRARAALDVIPSDCPHDEWLKSLMAIKSQFGEAGRDLAESWSEGGDKYDKASFNSRWRSISGSGDGRVNIGTLYHIASEYGYKHDSNYNPTPPTPEEIAQREAKRKAAEDEQKARREKAATDAATIWNEAPPALADHPYLKRKGTQPHGARIYHGNKNINGTPCNGALLVLMYLNSKISGLQFITEEGKKLFLPGAEKGGYMIGKAEPGKPICICEGFATGATIHEATGYPVIVAFDAGNLHKMALAFREKNTDAMIILCADDDVSKTGQRKAEEAARAVGGFLALPEFGEDRPDGATDFNDMEKHCGPEAVKRVIDAAMQANQNYDPAGSVLNGLNSSDDTNTASATNEGLAGASGAGNGASNEISTRDIKNNGATGVTGDTNLNSKGNSVAPVDFDGATEATNSIPKDHERPTFRVFDNHWNHDKKEYPPGVWYFNIKHNREGEPTMSQTWVCSPLYIEADTADEQQHNFGRLIRFRNTRGKWRILAIPMELLRGSGDEMRGELLSMGVEINPACRHLLASYLQTSKYRRHVLCVLQVGWCSGGRFVLPDSVIGPDADGVIFQSGGHSLDEYTQGGTMEGWRAGIAARAVGNPLFMLGLSASFAGPLLKITNSESGGLHYVGESSAGKTTILEGAAATWGGPNMKRSWRATANGMEGAAALFNDGLLPLDEISECDPKEVGSIVYSLGNGTGKQRANRAGGARGITRWKCIVISTGERTIETTMAEGGHRAKAGQGVRLLDIPVNGKYGIWDDLHGMGSGAALSDAIKREAATHYGHAGRAFLEILTRDTRDMCKELESIKALPEFQTRSEDGQAKRAAGRFALLAFAGELATEYGITDWTIGEAQKAAAKGFKAWLAMRGGNEGNDERQKILRQITDFIDRYKDGRFSNADEPNEGPRIPDRAGYWRDTNGRREYLFNSHGMHEALKGFDFRHGLNVLLTAGVLPPPGSDGKRTKQVRIGGHNERLYAVRYDKLNVDRPEFVAPVASVDFDGDTENNNIINDVTPVASVAPEKSKSWIEKNELGCRVMDERVSVY